MIGTNRREWLGYMSHFSIYSETLDEACMIAVFEGQMPLMPLGMPPASSEETG